MAKLEKYQVKNVSTFDQFGIEPGQTGEVELTEDELTRACDRGSVEVVGGKKETPEEDTRTQEEKDQAEAQAKADAEAKEAEDKRKAQEEAEAAASTSGRKGR